MMMHTPITYGGPTFACVCTVDGEPWPCSAERAAASAAPAEPPQPPQAPASGEVFPAGAPAPTQAVNVAPGPDFGILG